MLGIYWRKILYLSCCHPTMRRRLLLSSRTLNRQNPCNLRTLWPPLLKVHWLLPSRLLPLVRNNCRRAIIPASELEVWHQKLKLSSRKSMEMLTSETNPKLAIKNQHLRWSTKIPHTKKTSKVPSRWWLSHLARIRTRYLLAQLLTSRH